MTEVLCAKCGQKIGSSPMYAEIKTDEAGEVVVETKCYHKQPQCLMELIEKVEAELFRSSN